MYRFRRCSLCIAILVVLYVRGDDGNIRVIRFSGQGSCEIILVGKSSPNVTPLNGATSSASSFDVEISASEDGEVINGLNINPAYKCVLLAGNIY